MALPTVRSTGTVLNVNGTDLTPVIGTHDTDDILFAFVESSTYTDTLTCATSGWAEVTGSPQTLNPSNAANSLKLSVFWKRAASSSETNPTISGLTNQGCGVVVAVDGAVGSGTPWDCVSEGAAAGANVTVPGDTTVSNDCLVLVVVAVSNDLASTACFSNWTNADLANITERVDQTFAIGNGGGLGIMSGEKATAGAYGDTTVTTTSDGGNARCYMTIAVRSTASGTATIEITWDDLSTIEDNFSLERSDDGGAYAEIATPAAGATSYSDDVAAGATYAYRIRSENANGFSAYSNIDTVVVPA